jgi:hypothetical protein
VQIISAAAPRRPNAETPAATSCRHRRRRFPGCVDFPIGGHVIWRQAADGEGALPESPWHDGPGGWARHQIVQPSRGGRPHPASHVLQLWHRSRPGGELTRDGGAKVVGAASDPDDFSFQ